MVFWACALHRHRQLAHMKMGREGPAGKKEEKEMEQLLTLPKCLRTVHVGLSYSRRKSTFLNVLTWVENRVSMFPTRLSCHVFSVWSVFVATVVGVATGGGGLGNAQEDCARPSPTSQTPFNFLSFLSSLPLCPNPFSVLLCVSSSFFRPRYNCYTLQHPKLPLILPAMQHHREKKNNSPHF